MREKSVGDRLRGLNSVCIQEHAWKAGRVTNKTFGRNNHPSGRETNPEHIHHGAVNLTIQKRISRHANFVDFPHGTEGYLEKQ